jgi:hydrogenase expression/formation protein HypE
VAIVTGDTKVVERGKADGVFITTTGIGVVPRASICPATARDPAIA